MTSSDICPCGSGKNYVDCCEPFITGRELPRSAESLMRSRYVAYGQKNNQYILETWHTSTRPDDPTPAEHYNVEWLGLQILGTEQGTDHDNRGIVDFRARYRVKGKTSGLDESSEFIRENGRWYYVDGTTIKPQVTRHLKTGRNDPCPCNSGKKFKKCCGKSALP